MDEPTLLRDVDLNLLRVLHVLLETQAVGVAAARLGVTAPAASNALRRLRRHFDDPLLVRQGARMVPTPRAEELRPLAAEAMRAVAQALGEPVPFEPRAWSTSCVVATSDHVDAVVLEPLREALGAEAPGLRLAVAPFTEAAGHAALDGRVALALAPRDKLPEGLRAIELFADPLVLVLRADAPAAAGEAPDVDALCRMEHVVVSPSGDAGPTDLDRALDARGRQRHVVRAVPAFASALLDVATTSRVTVLPRGVVTPYAARLGLACLPLPLPLPPVRIWMGWSELLHRHPGHRWLRGRLRALAPAAAGVDAAN